MKLSRIIIFLLCFHTVSFLQANKADSLWNIIRSNAHDTVKINVYQEIIWRYLLFTSPDSAEKVIDLQLALAERVGIPRFKAWAYNSKGVSFAIRGRKEAAEYYLKALKIYENTNDIVGMSHAYLNMGNLYFTDDGVEKAVNYFNKSLEFAEKAKASQNIYRSHINLGACYVSKVENLHKAHLKQEEEKYTALALKHFEKAKEIANSTMNIDISGLCQNLGTLYESLNEEEKALNYFKEGLAVANKFGNKKGVAKAQNAIAGIYLHKHDQKKAEEIYKLAYKNATEVGGLSEIVEVAQSMSKMYKVMNDHKQALFYYEKRIAASDSLNSNSNRTALAKQEMKYEYEKRAAADSVAHAKESEIKNVELKRQSAEIRAKKNQQYALFGGLFLVILFACFMFNRFKVTQKQKRVIELQKSEVEEQKNLVDEKQKEVLDSIKYAKRIQMALMPTEKQLSKIIDSFKN